MYVHFLERPTQTYPLYALANDELGAQEDTLAIGCNLCHH